MTNENSKSLIVEHLNVYCPAQLGGEYLKLLDDISFVLNRKEILGLVGETGAGKSILLDAIGGNLKPPLWAEAEKLVACFDGQVESMVEREYKELRRIWGKKIAFIPPNARDMLNPILKVGQQVSNVIEANLQLSREEARQKVVEMFKIVQMPDAERNYDNYPHELSGGMAQRVVISTALSMSPKLLLTDEPTMGLDVTIQRQVLDLVVDLLEQLQSSVILATRDLGIVANYCDKVAVLCDGQLVEFTTVREFFKNTIHPYSHHLLEASFASHEWAVDLEPAVTKIQIKKTKGKSGCRFANRCPFAKELCWSVNPSVHFINSYHQVSCHKLEDKSFDGNT